MAKSPNSFNPANPLIGVLAGDLKQVIYSADYLVYRRHLANLSRTLNAGLCFFSSQDIDYQHMLIDGIYYDRGRWAKKEFMFPNVLCSLGGLQKLAPNELAQLCQVVKDHRVRTVSMPFEFNKWDVYGILSGGAGLKAFLPETKLLRNDSDLIAMLNRYGEIYLKACRGRRGEQVLRLKSMPDGAIECSYYSGAVNTRVVQTGALFSFINSFFRNRKFVIQQSIDLLEYKGSKVNLRAELQRNGRGRLEIAGIPVRVALAGSPITTHATCYRFEQFFLEMTGGGDMAYQELKKSLYRLLDSVYRRMEEYFGPLGEIGIDIGLDKNNRLWVIECNALSAMVSLFNAYGDGAVHKAFSNSFKYALYKVQQETLSRGDQE